MEERRWNPVKELRRLGGDVPSRSDLGASTHVCWIVNQSLRHKEALAKGNARLGHLPQNQLMQVSSISRQSGGVVSRPPRQAMSIRAENVKSTGA